MFSKLFGKSKNPERAEQLIRLLNDYPDFPVPCKGEPVSLTNAQAEANLTAFVEAIPERLAALRALSQQFGLSWPAELSLDASKELIVELHTLAGETWRHVLPNSGRETTRARWLAGERSGDYKILSLVSDTALLLGTIIIHERPGIRWGIDADEQNPTDKMIWANRVVLLAPWKGDAQAMKPIDVEWVVLGRLTSPDDVSERFENIWLKQVEGASAGGYEGVGVVDE